MLLCISCSTSELPMRSYIVLHNATNRSSDIAGKHIWEHFEDGVQLTNCLSNFKSFKFVSKIYKIT